MNVCRTKLTGDVTFKFRSHDSDFIRSLSKDNGNVFLSYFKFRKLNFGKFFFFFFFNFFLTLEGISIIFQLCKPLTHSMVIVLPLGCDKNDKILLGIEFTVPSLLGLPLLI